MPRSGTTLVEQIISCHPQAFGAGELYFIGNFERSLLSQNNLRRIGGPAIHSFAEQYLAALRAHSTVDTRVVDKMPSNFLRLGLIKTLYPNARVIYFRRDPLDTCLSIHFQFFARGNEYAFDLDELGRYYLDYARLMEHWRSIRLPGFFAVKYEGLVTNQEAISRQIVEHLGLK